MTWPRPSRFSEEAMTDRLVTEHAHGEHRYPVIQCPRCDEEYTPEGERAYCQFCYALFTPVPGRIPSLACQHCWKEIQIGIKKGE